MLLVAGETPHGEIPVRYVDLRIVRSEERHKRAG